MLLDGLEKNFMALAECAHNLENSDISEELLGVMEVTSAWVVMFVRVWDPLVHSHQSCTESIVR